MNSMMMLLAAVEGRSVVFAIIQLIVFGVIFWILKWAVDYFEIPEPFKKVIMVILVLGAVIICINALLSLIGRPFITW